VRVHLTAIIVFVKESVMVSPTSDYRVSKAHHRHPNKSTMSAFDKTVYFEVWLEGESLE